MKWNPIVTVIAGCAACVCLCGCPQRAGNVAAPADGTASAQVNGEQADRSEGEKEVDQILVQQQRLQAQQDRVEQQVRQALAQGDNERANQLSTQLDGIGAQLDQLDGRQQQLMQKLQAEGVDVENNTPPAQTAPVKPAKSAQPSKPPKPA